MSENQTSFLIHGHTHRPKIHDVKLATGPAHRVVLGDWNMYGWYIWIDSNSWELKKIFYSLNLSCKTNPRIIKIKTNNMRGSLK